MVSSLVEIVRHSLCSSLWGGGGGGVVGGLLEGRGQGSCDFTVELQHYHAGVPMH